MKRLAKKLKTSLENRLIKWSNKNKEYPYGDYSIKQKTIGYIDDEECDLSEKELIKIKERNKIKLWKARRLFKKLGNKLAVYDSSYHEVGSIKYFIWTNRSGYTMYKNFYWMPVIKSELYARPTFEDFIKAYDLTLDLARV